MSAHKQKSATQMVMDESSRLVSMQYESLLKEMGFEKNYLSQAERLAVMNIAALLVCNFIAGKERKSNNEKID